MALKSQSRRIFAGAIAATVLMAGWLAGRNPARPEPPARELREEANALAAAAAMERAFVKVIAEAEKSLVSIARVKRNTARPQRRFDNFFPRVNRDRANPASPDFIPNEFGAGIIVAPLKRNSERFILTNYHVVKGGPTAKKNAAPAEYRLYVRFANRRGCFCRILAADPRSDLAILKIDYAALGLKPGDLKPLKLGPAATFRKGQLVLALGNPYALARDGSASVSWGMISNISRRPKPAGESPDLLTRKKETIHHFGTLLHATRAHARWRVSRNLRHESVTRHHQAARGPALAELLGLCTLG